MARYKIVESVGNRVEDVERYEDLEKHHPSSGREPGRDYQTINGRLEEVRHENGITYVKKDFVLEVNGSDRNVQIPSPASGYVHRLNDGTNAIRIYDKPFGTPGAQFLGQVLHTERGSNPAEGARIEYGKPIGIQSSTGSQAIHAHVELPVDQFKQYISDIAQGRIQTGGVVTATPPSNTPSNSGTLTDKLLEKGEDGPGVKRLQEALNAAGVRVNGQPLPTTGHFGDQTEAAVKQYQQQKGLEVDGRAGKDTLTALGLYPGQQQAPTPSQPQPQPQPQQPTPGAQQNPYGFGPDNELGRLIGRGEGSYNSYNRGNAGDSSNPINLSDLTVGEVMRRQSLSHNDPNYLFAVGKYQFVPNTLNETVNALGIDKNAKFTPQLQEKMFADYLIDEKRPAVHNYITGKTGGPQGLESAQHALALEFASVGDPRNGGRSAYDGLAGNSASITPKEVQTALDHMREQYQKNVQSGMTADQAYKALSGDPNRYSQTAGATGQTRAPGGGLDDKLLVKGEDGPGVKRLQESLNAAGVRVNGQPLPTTGHFGDQTEAAVKQYQQQKGLEVDGKAGKDTLTALGIYPGQQQTTPQRAPTPQQPSPAQTPSSQGQATTDGTVSHGGKFTPEVRAYLDLVAWKETAGGLNRTSYNENNGVRGSTGHFTQADVEAGNGFPKTAGNSFNVGRYQFNREDWGDAKKADPTIKGYSPEDQDKVAYWTMAQKRPGHNVIDDLNRGDIRAAIRDGGYEWASLPGAHAGNGKQVQPGYTVEQAVDYYNQRLSHYRSLEQGQTQGQNPSQPSPASPQSSASADSGTTKDKLLEKGEDGPGVKRLQEALNAAGVRVNGQPLPTTGHFGDQTEAAVKQYQQQKGLEVDGRAGKDTLTALGLYPGQQQTTPQPAQQTPAQQQPTQQTPAQQQPTQQQPAQQTPPAAASEKPPTEQGQPQRSVETAKPSIADPKHPDHRLYEQAMANLQQLGPSGGFKSQDELTKAAAAVAADAKASGLNAIDHVAKTSTPNGQTLLIAVEGNPTNPASKNSYIDYTQATTQTVDQSSRMAEAARMHEAQPQAQTQDNRVAVSGR